MNHLTVKDLIAALENEDPNAPVYIMHQQNWPFELEIGGICNGADLVDEESDNDDSADTDYRGSELPPRSDCVYLVETGQTRYGDRNAWDAKRQIRRSGRGF